MNISVDQVDALLPQTQCRQCGFAGCLPYAKAIVGGETDINRCPPGGARTIESLATLLGRRTLPLDPALPEFVPGTAAAIDERNCIGCLKCVRACPVDAIIGAAGQLHAVVPDWCTGCGLCLPPCPVDCIELRPAGGGRGLEVARDRFLARQARGQPARSASRAGAGVAEKQAYIRGAVERVRARRRRKNSR